MKKRIRILAHPGSSNGPGIKAAKAFDSLITDPEFSGDVEQGIVGPLIKFGQSSR